MKEFVLSGGLVPRKKIDYQKALNAEQLPVVEGADGACLVLAGAGSGKTRTITYRVAWLLEQGIPPERILLLTFTNKAAREMITRIEALLGAYPTGLMAGTFHSTANRLLRQYGSCLGFKPNFSILDQEDARDLLSLCMKDLGFDPKLRKLPSPAVLHECLSYVRNTGGDMDSALERKFPRLIQHKNNLQAILARYMEQKRAQNAMDFDDLLLLLLEVLKKFPDICNQLALRFEYVLVDEFQDTNIVQAEIVSLLSGVHKNVLVVGDDAQSIYSFRAAEIRNILDFPNTHEGSKLFHMTTNYRSTPQILDTANAVIGKNIGQFKKELLAVVAEGEKPCLVPSGTAREEAQYILQQIQRLQRNGTALSEIAVLFRSAFHSQALEFELMRAGLPYEYRGGMRFFERSHVKDAVAHLRVVHNVADIMAWIRTLTIHPGLGLATANKIAMQCALMQDVGEAIANVRVTGKKASAGWDSSRRMWTSILAGNEMPSMLIRGFAGSRDYKTYLEHEFPNAQDRLDDLEQFANFAEQFQDLTTFLEAVTLTEEYAMRKEDTWEDRLILSTIHQAKGLEWDAVFIMRLNEGAFPHKRVSNEEEGGMEEERRLFYVAITRARKRLFLTYPLMAGFGRDELQMPSPFISEIPEDQIEVVKLRRMGFTGNSYGDEHADEPVIVLGSDGERISKPLVGSFLRNIDEL